MSAHQPQWVGPLIAMLILCAVPLDAGAWLPLEKVSARIRVGDAIGALELLAEIDISGMDDDTEHIYKILHARALVVGGLYSTAEKILTPLIEQPDPATKEIILLLALRSSVALRQFRETQSYAQTLLSMGNIAQTTRTEATYRLAEAGMWTGSPEQVVKSRKALVELLGDISARSLRPMIFELLANMNTKKQPHNYAKRLIIDYGETVQGQRAAKLFSPKQLTTEQQLSRARNLFRNRAYELAEKSYKILLKTPSMRQEALVKLGTIRTRMRDDYHSAVRLFTEAANGSDPALATEAWFRLGVSLGHLNRFDEAIEAMRTCHKRESSGPYAMSSGYQVGRLNHEAKRFTKAANAHREFIKRKWRDPPKWQWFYGWSYFRAGSFAKARNIFAPLKKSKNQLEGAKARYWTAKAYLNEGLRKRAKTELQELFNRAPLGYYGLLGQHLYAQEFDKESSSFPLRPKEYPVALPLKIDLRSLATQFHSPSIRNALREIQMLVDAGFPEIARHRNKSLQIEKKLSAQLNPIAWAQAEATLDLILERHRPRWTRLAPKRLAWEEGLMKRNLQDVLESYPLAYHELARQAGRLHNIHPSWLMAHMLQESRYYSGAVSGAGALGVMQILPRTGERIATRIGYPNGPFVASYLFEPGISIRYAAWYLNALREEFNGNTPLAIAGYNGGPLLLGQHLRVRPGLPSDILIEEIGPHESRNYVRKVIDHLVRYANLYLDDEEREEVLRPLLPQKHIPPPRGTLLF